MILVALYDKLEDQIRGIKAHDFLDSASVVSSKESAIYANFYQPVRSMPFRKLMSKLNLKNDGSFIDIGAGTGKAMILALDYGFTKVKGIEIVEGLVEIAEENRQSLNIPKEKFVCIADDALNYEYAIDDKVIFFNDPFSNEVFAPLLKKLEENILEKRVEVTFIYKNNSKRDIESYKSLLKKYNGQEINIWGNFFQIFTINKELP